MPTATRAALGDASWIWRDGAGAPGEYVLFRKSFFLEEVPQDAVLRVTADDAYELYVNGTMAGKGSGWQDMERFEIGPHLRAGQNTLGLRAENTGDAAGVAAEATWTSADGSQGSVVTDSSWLTEVTPRSIWNWETIGYDDSEWTPATALGKFGKTEPWGDQVKPPAEPEPRAPGSREGLKSEGSFQFHDGDRVVLLGGTFVERHQQAGYFETAVTAAHPDKSLVFRNLGWSGDDVMGTSRGRFGFQPEGFRHLVHHVTELDPTVILVSYGANEAYEGEDGIPAFRKNLEKLLDTLEPTGARIVLVTPQKQEALGGKLPDPTPYNTVLGLYVDVLEDVADQRGFWLVDLYRKLPVKTDPGSDTDALTYNSRHLTDEGQRKAAEIMANALGAPAPDWNQTGELRRLVVKKNELYFHRWRPQNETYLTLFRKHEQGNNYREIPQFDPLIAEIQSQIDAEKKALVRQ